MNIKPILKQDFLDYINRTWQNESDEIFIDMYTNGYSSLGNGLGLYDNEKLIGFIYYKTDINVPWWFKKTQESKPKFIPKKYNKLWEFELLEIHPDHRFKGLGSKLVQEVYNRMPNGYVLINWSERTDNHVNFYRKNGCTHNTYIKHPNYYFFFKIKE